jgi:hypothetical protein
MIRNGIICCLLLGICLTVTSCTQKSIPTERPYVFVDNSGNEYRGFYSQPEMPGSVIGKSGILTVSYENGNNWIEGNLINGQFHGTVRMWRPDGTLFSQEEYASGTKHGRVVWYNPDGTVDFEGEWVNGKKK